MTDAYGNNTMTPRRLGVLLAAGCAFWAGIALLFASMCGLGRAHAETTYLACDVHQELPVSVAATDPVWLDAIDEWNQHYPGTFVVDAAGVQIVSSDVTWVSLPCDGQPAVIHAGRDVNLSYWAAHELGHVLSLRDWVPAGYNTTGYINPGQCGTGYSGIMSYCTPRSQWWGADDDRMMSTMAIRTDSATP